MDYHCIVDNFAKLLRGSFVQCTEAEQNLVSAPDKGVDEYLREMLKAPVDEEIKLAAKDILGKRRERKA